VVDGVRVSPKNRSKALVCAIGFGAFTGLWGSPCLANDTHVENRCPQLSMSAYEELDARVLLLLKGAGAARPLPAVVCNDIGSWVEWGGRRFDILGRAPIADEVVDIVEAELHRADASAKAAEDAAVDAGEPMLQRGGGTAPPLPSTVQPADRIALRPADARGGGISAAAETELVSDSIGIATGPAFDFGSSVGPLLLGGREAFRFTFAARQVALMDFEASIGYGAPFNPDALFGAVLRFGAEWMVAYPEGNSGQAAVVPVIDFGLRVGHSSGLVGWWLGADARFRTQPLGLHSTDSLVASDVSGSFSLGVAFVDWSRK
jgi:hypothetical protein